MIARSSVGRRRFDSGSCGTPLHTVTWGRSGVAHTYSSLMQVLEVSLFYTSHSCTS